jgi:outer membrane lipoprotein-sorting protein
MMKKRKSKIILVLTFFLLALSPAGMNAQKALSADEIEAFRKGMKEASESTRNISSDFEQIKHLSFLEEDVASMGLFYFEKENKLRWEYIEPFFYLIIFNKDTVVIQDDRKTNVYDASSGQMFSQINKIMLSMVNGTILESDNFEFEYFRNPNGYLLELTPLDENMRDFLSKIRLTVNKLDFTVDELYMIERSDDYTHIRFINKKLNEDIPEHIFELP